MDTLTGGHKEHVQMAGGVAQEIIPAAVQYLDSSVVIPEKYTPDTSTEAVPQIELMHFDFDTPPATEPVHGDAANKGDVREAA